MNNTLHFHRKTTRTGNVDSDFLNTAQKKNGTIMLERKNI